VISHVLYFHKKVLANAVFFFHLGWAALILCGSIFAIGMDWYRPIHFALMAITISAQLLFRGCPLTILESALRRSGDERFTDFKGRFIAYYLDKWFGFKLSVKVVTVGAWLLFLFAAVLFVAFLLGK